MAAAFTVGEIWAVLPCAEADMRTVQHHSAQSRAPPHLRYCVHARGSYLPMLLVCD